MEKEKTGKEAWSDPILFTTIPHHASDTFFQPMHLFRQVRPTKRTQGLPLEHLLLLPSTLFVLPHNHLLPLLSAHLIASSISALVARSATWRALTRSRRRGGRGVSLRRRSVSVCIIHTLLTVYEYKCVRLKNPVLATTAALLLLAQFYNAPTPACPPSALRRSTEI